MSLTQNGDYYSVKCDYCKGDMTLDEHSVIFGNLWYHERCFIRADLEDKLPRLSKVIS